AFGIKVYAVGTAGRGPATAVIDDPRRGRVTVQVDDDLDEELLAQIAQITGGKSYRAESKGELAKIFAQIDSLEKSEIKRPPVVAVADHHVPPLAAGALLLLAESALAATALLRWP
ncbi:MAG: aerotolerance regulator BatA, partial [Elusimicrobia bacterium]|nr:aerotolerance regulator BatA [Elusimicrobiota bacterium]